MTLKRVFTCAAVECWQEPPRTRTVLKQHRDLKEIHLPWVQYYWDPRRLPVFRVTGSREPIADPEDRVCALTLPHFYGTCVCVGDRAMGLLKSRLITVVDAVWMTSFHFQNDHGDPRVFLYDFGTARNVCFLNSLVSIRP